MVANGGEKPLYSLATVKALVRTGAYQVVTRKAQNDYAALGFSSTQFEAVINALMGNHFLGVIPDCRASAKWSLDCDSYRIEIDRNSLVPRRQGGTYLYLKFGVTGSAQLVAFFSCHD